MDDIHGNAKQIEYSIFARCEVCGNEWLVAAVFEDLEQQIVQELTVDPNPTCTCNP